MIIPFFKIGASICILIFFSCIITVIHHLFYWEYTYAYPELLFGIVVSIIVLLLIGILYVLWEREVKIFYKWKESKRK